MSLKFFEVDKQYINYIKKYENKIMDTANEKEKRSFLGIVLKVYGYDYLVPLTSPKLKYLTMKNQLDFFKINNGNLGVINFKNMFPVSEKIRFKKNINDEKEVLKENMGCVKLKLTKEEREKLEKDRINPNYKYIPKEN
ncbi:MAG: type III toxin-antitoxin system ToxN/AbiQ family toxin [Cetobacterium sp.]|nr:type III toxin-antitoxin system ToxN/AbiQ family toxin [Cetobacterium sp.]